MRERVATFGHLGAGLALSRLAGPLGRGHRTTWGEALLVTSAAAAPDVDFLLPLRHRGMTHSVGFATAVGAVVLAAAWWTGWRRALALAALTAAAAASHALLDIATGEAGAEAAWPAVDERLSLSFAPLPSAPVGRDLFTPSGAVGALGELGWATALAVIGLWPFRSALRRFRASTRS